MFYHLRRLIKNNQQQTLLGDHQLAQRLVENTLIGIARDRQIEFPLPGRSYLFYGRCRAWASPIIIARLPLALNPTAPTHQGFSKIVGAACSRDPTGQRRPPSRVPASRRFYGTKGGLSQWIWESRLSNCSEVLTTFSCSRRICNPPPGGRRIANPAGAKSRENFRRPT